MIRSTVPRHWPSSPNSLASSKARKCSPSSRSAGSEPALPRGSMAVLARRSSTWSALTRDAGNSPIDRRRAASGSSPAPPSSEPQIGHASPIPVPALIAFVHEPAEDSTRVSLPPQTGPGTRSARPHARNLLLIPSATLLTPVRERGNSPCCIVAAASLEKADIVIKWPERFHPSRARSTSSTS